MNSNETTVGQTVRYALRLRGSGSGFAAKLPFEFEEVVMGWNNPDMLTWKTEAEAEAARAAQEDRDSLSVEVVLT